MSFWSKSLSILLAVSPHSHVKRQLSTIPAICYAICNEASIDAQFQGKVPALCATNGKFQQDLTNCTTCIQDHAANQSVDVLPANLLNFINYCNYDNAEAIISSVSSEEASISLQVSSLSSKSVALCYSLASLGDTSSAACAQTTSPTGSSDRASTHKSTQASQTPSQASQSSSPAPPPKSNTGTIIGAAVGGSIGGILLIAFVFAFFIMRRRKHRKALVAAANQSPEKAQLHSDDYQPPRKELLGTLGKKQYDRNTTSELPSNEPVERTTELPVNEEVGAELDNRVKIPKTDVSSQSTKVGSGP